MSEEVDKLKESVDEYTERYNDELHQVIDELVEFYRNDSNSDLDVSKHLNNELENLVNPLLDEYDSLIEELYSYVYEYDDDYGTYFEVCDLLNAAREEMDTWKSDYEDKCVDYEEIENSRDDIQSELDEANDQISDLVCNKDNLEDEVERLRLLLIENNIKY